MKFSELPLPWIISGIPTYFHLKRRYPSVEDAALQFGAEQRHQVRRSFWYVDSTCTNTTVTHTDLPDLPSFDITTQNTIIMTAYGVEKVNTRARAQNL